MHESTCDVVLTAGGTVRVKEVKVIAHAIACRGRAGAYPRGGGIWGTCPPLEPNAQRKNLRRLKDLKGQIQQKYPKFSK